MKKRLEAYEACLFILLCIKRYSEEKNKKITRIRFSENNLKELCRRQRIRTEFLDELEEQLLGFGWCLVKTKSHYALIQEKAVNGWTHIATDRVSKELKDFDSGKLAREDFEEIEENIFNNN